MTRFFYHYNKPASHKAGRAVLSLHFNHTCHLVNSITCNVPTRTKERKTQPRMVVQGQANEIMLGSDPNGVSAEII